MSDPFGWGWNLLGTASYAWQPYGLEALPWLQCVVLAVGLAWSCRLALTIANESLSPIAARRQALPVVGFSFAAAAGMLWLLVG
jgi:hypothetical protein